MIEMLKQLIKEAVLEALAEYQGVSTLSEDNSSSKSKDNDSNNKKDPIEPGQNGGFGGFSLR